MDKLNNTWVSTYAIKAFIPRFSRPVDESRNGQERAEMGKDARKTGEPLGDAGLRAKGGVSYAVKLASSPGNRLKDKEELGRERGRLPDFLSTEDEGSWLHGALTARLKDDFLWKFHGEDLQNEYFGRLKMTDMGDRMVLIRSETERSTDEVIQGFEEWANWWFDWWHPWRSSDINQRCLVWTK